MAGEFINDMPPELQAEMSSILARRQLAAHNAQRYGGGIWGRQAQNQMQALDQPQQEVLAKYNAGLASAVDAYRRQVQGSPEIPMPPEEAGGGPGRPGVAADPQGAVVQAMMSQYGPLQRLGAKQYEHELKLRDPYTLPEGAVRVNPGPGGAEGTKVTNPKVSEHAIPDDWSKHLPPGAKRLAADPAGIYRMPGADGATDVYQLEFDRGALKGSKKLDNSPRISVDARQGGPKIGAQEYFRQAGKDVGDLADKARAAQDVKNSIAQMANLDSRGMFSNVTSGPATFMANLSQIAGIQLTPQQQAGLQNTETYNAIATDAWQKLVAQYGGNRGVTKEEAEQIKTILPLTKNSPQAREQLYGILNQVADRSISRFRVSNAAYARALQSDDPRIWAKHMEETFLPTVPSMPATRVPRPENFGGRRIP